MEWEKGDFIISTDKKKIDLLYVHGFLASSYWAKNIPVEKVVGCIAGSLCFGVYQQDKQVGFARVITDEASFAYLADVFIDGNFRGRGLGKWLIEVIMNYPTLQGLRRFMLATRDAHELYSKFGFEPLSTPERWMQIHTPEVYSKS